MSSRNVVVHASMLVYPRKGGHTQPYSAPCTVYGLYLADISTLVIDVVMCDGREYYAKDLSLSDRAHFMELLKEKLADLLF